MDEFNELLSKISTDFDNIMISGDFNIHIDNHSDTYAKELTDLGAFELTQHISGPIHKHGHTLDQVISKGINVTAISTSDVATSDTFYVSFNLSMNQEIHSSMLKTVRKCYIDECTR